MRISGIVHQQICQLKWHLLACFGLIMVLPVEEAIVNLQTGDGFYSAGGAAFTALFAPLLAGLIACANVQADLNEKRYIFWRSKPAGIKLLMALKFVIGLIAALAVLACPAVFSIVTSILSGGFHFNELVAPNVWALALTFLLMPIMTYSLCFACNVIVRNTARSWLIGMFLACSLLILPLMLPLDVKDVVTDVVFGISGFYLPMMLTASAVAFVFALLAAQHDWHLQTSLKGMLWATAALVFALMILLANQVANIKVLDEQHVGDSWHNDLNRIEDRIIYRDRTYVDIDDDRISLTDMKGADPNTSPLPEMLLPRELKDCNDSTYPDFGDRMFHETADGIYNYTIHRYYLTELFERPNRQPLKRRNYKSIVLNTDKLIGKSFRPVCDLDLSDCLTDQKDRAWMGMRLIDNMIVVRVNNSVVVVNAKDPSKLKRIETKLDVLKKLRFFHTEDPNRFAIPLLPIESINLENRVKFSIDLRYSYPGMYNSSMVDIHNGVISLLRVSEKNISRFVVTNWDNENIYCTLAETRPFTPLEHLTAAPYSWRTLVRNGRLYHYHQENLMVFDIRPGHRIRKLGHFVRMQHDFHDIAPLNDGRILLSTTNYREMNEYNEPKAYLYLLENPG